MAGLLKRGEKEEKCKIANKVTKDAVEDAREKMQRRLTKSVKKLAVEIGVSFGSAHKILRNKLGKPRKKRQPGIEPRPPGFTAVEKKKTGELTENEKESYKEHVERKEAARNLKDVGEEKTKNNKTMLAFEFDLQAVLSTPKGAQGPLFYVRKLAVYN
ncbi:hypothetical protein ANN_03725 [Periplaneta americana]|uniref:Uncharacterized protein n=1 Tax=Periplaneta americana TaxID=6978 RepID=A0ABQ8U3K5_PERAM|nr:hypothetical protein ANN_03725 [Periplaneta americana]